MKEQQEKYNLPKGWTNVSLGDIITLEYGKSLPKNSRQDGNYSIFGSNGIIGHHNDFSVEGPVIIIGRKGSVGSVHLSNENCWPIDTTYYIKPTFSLNFKFTFFLLESLNLSQLDKSTTIPGLNRDNVYEQIIDLPPLNEQDRIVLKLEEILSSLEKSKEQLENSLNQLGLYKQSVLNQAFEGKLTEEWRKNQNDLKTPQQIVNEINAYQEEQYKKELSDFNEGKNKLKPRQPEKIPVTSDAKTLAKLKLPKEWSYIQLKDVCHVTERVSLKERKSEDSFIYLDIGSINNKKNIIEAYKEYQWKDAPSRAQYVIEVNDILFSTVRTYLKNIAMIEEEKFDQQIASSGFAVIRVFDNFMNPKYVFKYIISDNFIQPLNELQSGSSYPAVRSSDVLDQFIPICSIDEQNAISEELDRQFSIVNHFGSTIEKNLLNIESLKQSVIRKAFEGKLSEQDNNDESARILLERIKVEKKEYLWKEKENRNNSIKIKTMSEKSKSIIEILNETTEPISSKQLWLFSDKKNDIEDFYAELKKHIESGEIIELPRNGKESFLKLAGKS